MRIVIATGTYPPEVSGQATFVADIQRALKEKQVDCSVVTYADTNSTASSVVAVARTPWRYLAYFRALRRQLNADSIIYAQDLISSGIPAAFAKRRGVKMAIRIGGDFLWEKMVNRGSSSLPLRQYYEQPKNILERFILLLYRFVLRRADHIIFNTEWQQRLYIRQFGLPANKTSVITNYEFQEEINQPQTGQQEIVYVGRLVPLKNVDKLIEAYQRTQSPYQLRIIGEGPDRPRLEKRSLNISNITFTGQVPRGQLGEYLRRAAYIVLPSLTDLSPNVLLEASSYQVPVLLTTEVGLSEVIAQKYERIDPASVETIAQGLDKMNRATTRRVVVLRRDSDKIATKHLEIFGHL